MKKVYIVLMIGFMIFHLPLFSQDIIYMKDGSKEEAKVILVSDREIQFRKFDAPDGPVYVMKKSDILLITYENGNYDLMYTGQDREKTDKLNFSVDFARNIFSYHLFDLVFGDFAISYERILPSGKVGFKVPIAIGYDDYNDYANCNNLIYSGLGINFYPTGQGKWRYFLGPQLRVGYAREYGYEDYYDEQGNYLFSNEVENEGIYSKFFVDNGVLFMPLKNFSISAIGSLGIRYFPEASYEEDVLRTDGAFALNLSYRF